MKTRNSRVHFGASDLMLSLMVVLLTVVIDITQHDIPVWFRLINDFTFAAAVIGTWTTIKEGNATTA